MRWYVIRTKPHQERQAEFHLRQLSVETYLPLFRQHKRVRRQEKTVVEPLFPRYLFARFDIQDRYRAVSFSRGVQNIVEFGLKPAEVSESLFEAIRGRAREGCVTPGERFQKGQIVRIRGDRWSGLRRSLSER